MQEISRKNLLYKTGVEYGDYTINHVEGCSHGCKYPCYALLMSKRFGRIKSYNEWLKPKIVVNAIDLLKKEIPKHKKKISFVNLCFFSDPFMFNHNEVKVLSLKITKLLNENDIKCIILTKGKLPIDLLHLSSNNEYGISLVSLDENFRSCYEPFSAPFKDRINNLYKLHKKGLKTWVSIEPYPTPNIIKQDIKDILKAVAFVDKIIFVKLNYNSIVSKYIKNLDFYNNLAFEIIDYCKKNNKSFHIKKGTIK